MLLEFKNVSLRYPHDKCDALSGLSFTVSDGENKTIFIEWQGGKTSVAKLISGLLRPTAGEILYKDKLLTASKDNKIAIVFEDFALMERKTVKHNLEYGMRLRNIDKNLRDKLSVEIAERFSLDKYIDTIINKLGSGFKFRTALARSYWREVDLLILDNVFARIPSDLLPDANAALSLYTCKQKCAVLRLENPADETV